MDASAVVSLLGGLGLFLLGIYHLTDGMKGLAGDALRRALHKLVAGRLSAVLSGAFFAGPRVLVPPAARVQVRRAQLPLAQRIVDAGLEAAGKRRCCALVQKPITISTPARLYQLRGMDAPPW